MQPRLVGDNSPLHALRLKTVAKALPLCGLMVTGAAAAAIDMTETGKICNYGAMAVFGVCFLVQVARLFRKKPSPAEGPDIELLVQPGRTHRVDDERMLLGKDISV